MSNLLIQEYQKTGSKEIENQLLDLHKNYIRANINKWSGIIPQSILDAYGKHYAINAFKTFDPNKGASINTHLYNNISQLSRHIYTHQNTVKLPEHQVQMIGKVNQAKEYLTDELGYEPSASEIADHLSLPKQHIAKIIKNQRVDFINDSDTDMQIATSGDGNISDKIFTYRQTLAPKQQQQFDLLTGFGGVTPLKPQAFGQQFKLKPHEVSRLKLHFAKGLQ